MAFAPLGFATGVGFATVGFATARVHDVDMAKFSLGPRLVLRMMEYLIDPIPAPSTPHLFNVGIAPRTTAVEYLTFQH